MEQLPLGELLGGPSSHLVPFALDGALVERSTHGALPSEMVSTSTTLTLNAQLTACRVLELVTNILVAELRRCMQDHHP